jgi:hypothetical protein
VRFVVDKVGLGQVSFRILVFFSVSIVPTTLHTHPYLSVSVIGRGAGEAWER